jgi:hypothetical protein
MVQVQELKNRVNNLIEQIEPALASDVWHSKTGWGQFPGQEPDPWTTAQVIHLFRELRRSRHKSSGDMFEEDSIDYILKEQNVSDGGWGLNGQSSPPNTATILMLLSENYSQYHEQINHGIKFLSDMKDDAGWSALQHEPATHVTSLIIDCLNTVQTAHDVGNNYIQIQHLDPARDFLVKRQNDDGGWGEFNGSDSDAKQTAYAVFALSRAFINNEGAIKARDLGIKWLKKHYDDNGGFWGVGKGDIEATAIGVWALLATGISYRHPIIVKSIEYLLNSKTTMERQKQTLTGWTNLPNGSIQTWLTFFVLIAFIMFLDAIKDAEKISWTKQLSFILGEKRTTNAITLIALAVALILIVVGFTTSGQIQQIAQGIGVVIAVLTALVAFFNRD